LVTRAEYSVNDIETFIATARSGSSSATKIYTIENGTLGTAYHFDDSTTRIFQFVITEESERILKEAGFIEVKRYPLRTCLSDPSREAIAMSSDETCTNCGNKLMKGRCLNCGYCERCDG
jgi:hypothetical protein